MIEARKARFDVLTYTDDVDADVTENERDPKNGSYAIRVRERVEADEELKSTSANDIKAQNLTIMTPLERLVYELKFHTETATHLGIINWTLCSGSRARNGHVPNVYSLPDGRKLRVHWYDPDDSDGNIRARAVVSL